MKCEMRNGKWERERNVSWLPVRVSNATEAATAAMPHAPAPVVLAVGDTVVRPASFYMHPHVWMKERPVYHVPPLERKNRKYIVGVERTSMR